jgi:hypothetical protein
MNYFGRLRHYALVPRSMFKTSPTKRKWEKGKKREGGTAAPGVCHGLMRVRAAFLA